MRYALVDNILAEAGPGLKGHCPCCSQPVIGKNGTQRIRHWARVNSQSCDSWSELETEWHLAWKDNFPVAWQETFFRDEQTKEIHIADICTDYGLVIEFQHSHLEPQERSLRENFYKGMVWVVDGTRLKRDHARFLKAKKDFRPTDNPGIYYVDYIDECFPLSWIKSSVAVIFDFNGMVSDIETAPLDGQLYCLFPVRVGRYAIVAELARSFFIDTVNDGDFLIWVSHFVDGLTRAKAEREAYEMAVRIQQQQIAMVNMRRRSIYRKGRRF